MIAYCLISRRTDADSVKIQIIKKKSDLYLMKYMMKEND